MNDYYVQVRPWCDRWQWRVMRSPDATQRASGFENSRDDAVRAARLVVSFEQIRDLEESAEWESP